MRATVFFFFLLPYLYLQFIGLMQSYDLLCIINEVLAYFITVDHS